MKRLNLAHIAGGVVWLASVVKVFGFTWEAFKQTYTAFPSPGQGSQTAVPGGNLLTDPGNLGKKAGRTVTSWLEKIPGLGSLITAFGHVSSGGEKFYVPPEEINRLSSLPAPPPNIVAQIRAASKKPGGSADQSNAMNALIAWVNQTNGRWNRTDGAYFGRLLGIPIFNQPGKDHP